MHALCSHKVCVLTNQSVRYIIVILLYEIKYHLWCDWPLVWFVLAFVQLGTSRSLDHSIFCLHYEHVCVHQTPKNKQEFCLTDLFYNCFLNQIYIISDILFTRPVNQNWYFDMHILTTMLDPLDVVTFGSHLFQYAHEMLISA